MWVHLILVMLTQSWSVRNNPLVTLTNYLTTKTERGCEGEVVHITCGPGNKVTPLSLSLSQLNIELFTPQLSIQSVLLGSQAGSDPCGGGTVRCEAQSDQGVVQRQCQGRQECSFNISGHLLESQSLPCSGNGDRSVPPLV